MSKVRRLIYRAIPQGGLTYIAAVWLHNNADNAYKTANHPTSAFTALNITESLFAVGIGLVGGAIVLAALSRLLDHALGRLKQRLLRPS
ncbi:MAG TPA: hypothetical protein VLF41_00390 [Candidatus Nanoarchaeia archaeon]|nr:hypothetical protein [Candidatus Nanoarchaeia archaeon]